MTIYCEQIARLHDSMEDYYGEIIGGGHEIAYRAMNALLDEALAAPSLGAEGLAWKRGILIRATENGWDDDHREVVEASIRRDLDQLSAVAA